MLGDRVINLSGIVLSDLDLPRHSRMLVIKLINQIGKAVHVCIFNGQNVISFIAMRSKKIITK